MDVRMDMSDFLTLLVAAAALAVAISAEVRSRKNQKIQDKELERSKVRFKCTKSVLRHNEYIELHFVHTGIEPASTVTLDPDSVITVAIRGIPFELNSEPGKPFEFSYVDPGGIGRLKSVVLTWKGPGVGRQTVPIPPLEDSEVSPGSP